MLVGSLFSGIGGFDLGLEQSNHEVGWQIEKDPQCLEVLNHHWPKITKYEDINEVDPTNLTKVDVICGGFPCQDYSLVGKREGIVGNSGSLWWQMHRIVAHLRPTWVVAENVPGLLHSNKGKDFLTIVDSLVQLGYGVVWAILDSKYFGIPQQRRRLFFVGHSGGFPKPEVLAIEKGLRRNTKETKRVLTRTVSTGTEEQIVAIPDPAYAINAGRDGHTTGRRFGTGRKAQDTFIISPDVSGKHVARYLTPLECERVQGFPDNWTKVSNLRDTARYRIVGNAVSVPVAAWIGQNIS